LLQQRRKFVRVLRSPLLYSLHRRFIHGKFATLDQNFADRFVWMAVVFREADAD